MSFRRIIAAAPQAMRLVGKNFKSHPIGMHVAKTQMNAGLFNVSCRAFASAKAEVQMDTQP